MSIIRLTYSGNIYDAAPAGQQDFPLTTSSGQPIPYLSADHIHVYSSADDGATWNELARPSDWDFATTAGTTVRLTNGITAGTWIRVQRFTPYQDLWTTFQEGSQLTAGQLNVGEEFSMYVDQELFDLSGSSWSTGNQTITEADQREGNWVSDDTHIATTGALSARFDVFTQATQPADPPSGEIRQPGKLWINTTTARVSYWDTTLQAWILIAAGITDAPADGNQYARKNNAWSIVSGGGGGIPEAPQDSRTYGRNNASWVVVSSGGGGIVYKGTIDVTLPAPSNPQNGDFYVNIGVGTVDASWTGMAGDTVSGGERLAYNGTTWEMLPSESNWTRGTNSLYPSVAGDSVLVGGVLPGLPAIALDSGGDGIFTGKLTAGEGYFVGDVGIGTPTPQAALDINAPGSTVPFIASINGSEKARIDLAGNFGVGTATPQKTLDVNGTVRATVFDIESLPALP